MNKIRDAELVIGIVGRIGVDTKDVVEWIGSELVALNYNFIHIKVTEYLDDNDFGFDVNSKFIEKKYNSRIDACNHIRELSKRNDFLMTFAIQSIIEQREQISGDVDKPAERIAYIIDQIKRPEEAATLRSIYGPQFLMISCHLPIDKRQKRLAKLIADGHPESPKNGKWNTEAMKLIERDERETDKRFGQRVSDVFPQADLIIDTSHKKSAQDLLKRFFEALFGNFAVSPTRDEFFQNIAFNVSLTSCDTGRQVGAVIECDGELVATGFNEAPRASGGTYWAMEEPDARDVMLGSDSNTVRKRQMVAEIVQMLRNEGELKNSCITDEQIETRYLDSDNAFLKKSQIMDTLEYGRAVHAEMSALSTAAKIGVSVNKGKLYCTTFRLLLGLCG